MANIELGRVVGSRIYAGSADSNEAIATFLTGQQIKPLQYDLFFNMKGNVYQLQLSEGTLKWQLVMNIVGPAGTFRISKTYDSVANMNAGFETDGLPVGALVVIQSNVEDEDNAKLYCKGELQYNYLADLSGKQGIKGDTGDKGAQGDKGEKGDTGNGIKSITFKDTAGLVDTYTVLYTDGTSTEITVKNGATGPQGPTGAKGADGKTPSFSLDENGVLWANYEA